MPLLSNKAALLEIKEGLFIWRHSSFYKDYGFLYVSNKKRDGSRWNRLFNISNKGKHFIIQPLALLPYPLLQVQLLPQQPQPLELLP
jgi:hypothetical protein